MTNRDHVLALHNEGLGTSDIAKRMGLTKASVSYHKGMLGLVPRHLCEPDWAAIQAAIDDGWDRATILKTFKIGAQRYTKAREAGLITKRRPKLTLEDRLVENSESDRGHLKRLLLEQGLIEEICAECALGTVWNGRPITLALDHINGVNNDNRLSNLRLLCPNCHSQTETFAGRNVRKRP